ncbi:MAG: 50S ribosomal protein L18 [Methanomicrobia archaeon]|nr:50S ribosomal protein L18 [Methanomicrobia archaeon]
MAKAGTPTYRVPFRRRREGKTDYRRRLRLLLSRVPRIVVRQSNHYIQIQLIATEPVGDNTILSVNSAELVNLGYKGGYSNCSAAYLTGLVFGHRARDVGVNHAILDIGRKTPIHGSNVYAALKGAIDSGMSIPHDPAVFPPDDRLYGEHISAYKKDDAYAALVRSIKETITGR